ncbi:MAG: hypothetical protein ABIU06_09860, partial [Anaerolineales bacterium]
YNEVVHQFQSPHGLFGFLRKPNKPSVQEIISTSMQALKIQPESTTKAEFLQIRSEWLTQQKRRNSTRPKLWQSIPNMFEGSSSFIIDTLFRYMSQDNPSAVDKINIHIPEALNSWPWLNIEVVYSNSEFGMVYGHHVGRFGDDSYLIWVCFK